FTLATTAMGALGGGAHGHEHFGGGLAPGHHLGGGDLGGDLSDVLGPLGDLVNVPSLVSFLTLFGGTGYLLTSYGDIGLVLVLVVATLAGFLAAWGMGLVLRRMRAGE